MTDTAIVRPVAGLALGACALAILALAGCGGGGESGTVNDHGRTSTTQHLECLSTCYESDTLATGGMVADFYIVDDGTRTQAQAGFHTGLTLGYNVELEGDTLYFVRDGMATQMGLPVDNRAIFPASPYLFDFAQRATAAVTGRFELRRAAQVYASSVTLPAPFNITSPRDGSVYSKASNAVDIQLDSARPEAAWAVVHADCRDTGDQLWVQAGGNAPSSMFTSADGRSVQFHAADYMASLQFTDTTTGAVASLKSCNFTLQATVTNGGTMADGFRAGSSISGLQMRTLKISLR